MSGNITKPIFDFVPVTIVAGEEEVTCPKLSGNNWHCGYRLIGGDDKEFYVSLIYDGDATCIRCGKKVNGGASVSCTRICGSCDMGNSGMNNSDRERYRKAKEQDPNAAWANVKHSFQFESKKNWSVFKERMREQTKERWVQMKAGA